MRILLDRSRARVVVGLSCTETALARFVKKIRVLIVEDNSDLRRLYAIGLNQRGFEVKLASNGAEAIERIASETPHVIVLDMIMPVMSGWDVINHVNNGERTCPIPVVVISGHPRPDGEPLHPCITAWLEKPISLEELIQSISQNRVAY